MKPALSLVFFTVLSGAGLGLAVFTTLFAGALSQRWFLAAIAISLLLVGGGLGASALHLANPKNAWRAFMRVRTSWLSREAVFAAVFFPLMALYAYLHTASPGTAVEILRVVLSIIALLTVYCTAMIYQSLKTIAQWHHPNTAFNYLALSLMSGGILFNAFVVASCRLSTSSLGVTALFVLFALIGKAFHYRRIGACQDISVGNATGFSQAKARLLDAGHTGQTFLTREFIYQQPAAVLRQRRLWAFALMFIPAAFSLLVTIAQLPYALVYVAIAVVLMLIGILLERWLFFAEAHHSVRAYHGVSK
ncbi:MAG: dimethyl sulfoxide reductase anchor subunit [Proteobacteria bacterium]|nr:dimethyl sulfoxide reductase anchor subunit [Pseudomonadota bacterium]